jgi:hypothetical protein
VQLCYKETIPWQRLNFLMVEHHPPLIRLEVFDHGRSHLPYPR